MMKGNYKDKLRILACACCLLFSSNVAYASSGYDVYNRHYVVIYQFIKENRPEMDATTADWMTKSIVYYASYYQVQPLLFTAMIKQESNFNMNAQSSAGAFGLTQIMPGTARSLGVNSFDPNQNVEGGARYLAMQLYRYQNHGQDSLAYALAAYNAGPGAISEYNGIPPYRETINYIQRVYHYYGELVSRYNNLK